MAPRQTGAVLLVSLILLLILTIIGIGSIGITTMDTKVATNSHDRQLAFVAAESAMNRSGVVLSPGSTSFPDASTPGYVTSLPNAGNTWWRSTDTSWWNSNAATLSEFQGLTGGTRPQYVIEPERKCANGNQTASLDTEYQRANSILCYRVTTMGVGPGGSKVFLQAVYAKKQYSNTP